MAMSCILLVVAMVGGRVRTRRRCLRTGSWCLVDIFRIRSLIEPEHDSHRSGSTLAVAEPTMTSLLLRVAPYAVDTSRSCICTGTSFLYVKTQRICLCSPCACLAGDRQGKANQELGLRLRLRLALGRSCLTRAVVALSAGRSCLTRAVVAPSAGPSCHRLFVGKEAARYVCIVSAALWPCFLHQSCAQCTVKSHEYFINFHHSCCTIRKPSEGNVRASSGSFRHVAF
jgi:hypothetical protein